jgi:prephenate dehydrogenase
VAGVAVIGVGLIGGSIGLAARERGLGPVTGWVRDQSRADRCVQSGAVDRVAPTLEEAVEGAELVFCCVSVGAIAEVAARALEASGEETVVTDVGSTKQELVARLGSDPRFIGGHPLAGAETAGVDSARADLYDDSRWFLTPTSSTSGMLYDRLQRFIQAIGARPVAIDAVEHDRAMAAVSHLPHVLANTLVGQGLPGSERLGAVAPSLRDATRVAGSNPAIWAEIFATNHEAVTEAIGGAIESLERARDVIGSADPDRIASWQREASEWRSALSEIETMAGATHRLTILVPNRPGVLAQIALALGEAGVNIADMSLDPAPDMSSGAISIWVAGQDQADRAVECVTGLGHRVTLDGGA